MVFRRCPQCGSTSDDIYGFCIKCGYEFPKIEHNPHTCPLCGYNNPDEADFCVKCGTPLLLKNQLENNSYINPIVIKRTSDSQEAQPQRSRFDTILVYLGYLFSILGGLVGLIIAIYLITRKDRNLKKHGFIQLAIFGFYIVLIAVLYATGNIPPDAIAQYKQLIAGNMTSLRL
ncbi:zinc ribbon domain-containing protein [Methanobrevibacter sp.]|uniref:zinc ribbon domain-containing protein n=1 Tax=Methanobrevibacter sp. TaxID=66852 RepID=UPI00386F6B1C